MRSSTPVKRASPETIIFVLTPYMETCQDSIGCTALCGPESHGPRRPIFVLLLAVLGLEIGFDAGPRPSLDFYHYNNSCQTVYFLD